MSLVSISSRAVRYILSRGALRLTLFCLLTRRNSRFKTWTQSVICLTSFDRICNCAAEGLHEYLMDPGSYAHTPSSSGGDT